MLAPFVFLLVATWLQQDDIKKRHKASLHFHRTTFSSELWLSLLINKSATERFKFIQEIRLDNAIKSFKIMWKIRTDWAPYSDLKTLMKYESINVDPLVMALKVLGEGLMKIK